MNSGPRMDEQMEEGNYANRESQGGGGEDGYVQPSYAPLPQEDGLEIYDWQYIMRRTMQEIIPGVYLGPYASATRIKLEEMKSAGLTHVICVRDHTERNIIRTNHPDHFKYLVVEIGDSAMENVIPHLKIVQCFIDECLAANGKVLVHGKLGISRSGALVVGYIMTKYGISFEKAYKFALKKRLCVDPNDAFKAQLKEYEPIYRAQHAFQQVPLPGEEIPRSSVKRTLDMDSDEEETNKSVLQDLPGPSK